MMSLIDVIEQLNGFGFFTVLMIFCLVVLGIIFAIKTFKEASGLFGKSHRQLMDEKIEQRLTALETRANNLEESAKKFNDDRVHDREQSFQIQHDLVNNLSQVSDALVEIKTELLEDKVERKRWNILNFADELRHNDWDADRERFDNVFRDYDDYERIIHEKGLTNGFVEESIKFIRLKYQEMLNE